MPTEFRFEDLDLREEPPSERTETQVYNTGAQPVQGDTDALTTNRTCTRVCCV